MSETLKKLSLEQEYELYTLRENGMEVKDIRDYLLTSYNVDLSFSSIYRIYKTIKLAQ